ncbi:MAG: tRNA (5-methylaminomethyl-2-thiouridine)(34)-methyltransferase MnmD [Rikenellaceae bacterium]|jgi:tRNA U34 5-methylaminomethyl-2-thiouridine-forming methyltransferase MnmC|nr:tRNA (5-methylaminomethyl-2-thiouridine)(34)-methyltransferase MnmD [Rikenellaceae bacterium]
MPVPRIEPTGDGSQTLLSPEGRVYHSVAGAVGESMHVFIGMGLRGREAAGIDSPLRVLEVGLGSGLNCLLSARESCPVRYTAVERYPVPEAVWSAMQYAADPVFGAIHRAPWGEWTQVTPAMELLKIEADLTAAELPNGAFDVIYMDAFAPDDQPKLWTVEVFRKLFAATAPGGILVTYCAKGDVKRALRAAGYTVRRLPGALGKRHMLQCIKQT